MKLSKVKQSQYESIIKRLKEKQLRLTDVRTLVIKIILEKEHPTIQDIIKEMKIIQKNVNVMSVYNTLDLLLENHTIFANTFNGKQICYEVVTPVLFHLKCDSCEKVVHIEEQNLRPTQFNDILKFVKANNMTTDHIKIESHGYCNECLKRMDN